MFIPVKYTGHARKYADDIAIIITKKIFDLSINVRPICVIWEMSGYTELLDPNKTKRAYVIKVCIKNLILGFQFLVGQRLGLHS